MSKTKKLDVQNKPSLEKKIKKKLNKRQRQIRKKLKESGKVKSNIDEKNSSIVIVAENVKSNTKLEKPSTKQLRAKDNSKNKSLQLSGKKNNFLKPITNNKDPESYSANWKQLQNIISDSISKNNQRTSLKRKREDLTSQQSISNNQCVETKKEDEVWFDDVDPLLIEDARQDSNDSQKDSSLKKQNSYAGSTKIIALDCEMVGGGVNGEEDLLARVSIVNHFGNVLYDKYVKPREPVKDYRTQFSGIRPRDLINGEPFEVVQKEVSDMMKGKLLVGHALSNDLNCLILAHPKNMIRDTSKYKPFIKLFGRGTPSLKKLTDKVLGVTIQSGEHDSIQDSQATMRLYTLHRKEWEENLRATKIKMRKKKGAKKETKEDPEK